MVKLLDCFVITFWTLYLFRNCPVACNIQHSRLSIKRMITIFVDCVPSLFVCFFEQIISAVHCYCLSFGQVRRIRNILYKSLTDLKLVARNLEQQVLMYVKMKKTSQFTWLITSLWNSSFSFFLLKCNRQRKDKKEQKQMRERKHWISVTLLLLLLIE